MTIDTTLARRGPGRPRRQHSPRRIKLPNGDELWPRGDLADELGIDKRTVQRMKLPTVCVGGVAYHPHRESLDVLASRCRPQPEPKRRRAR